MSIEATGRVRIAGSGVSLVYRTRKDAEEVALDPFQMLADHDRHIVLIIDEVTALCSNLGKESAADFLVALRRLRENNDRVAIVLSGSVGLHHIVPEAGATRGLIKVGVGPLAESEATELTIRLLRGIGVDAPDRTLVAEILQHTSSTPYYIQAVVDALRVVAEPWNIDETVALALQTDSWDTSHYVERVPGYFGERDEALVLAMLDATAVSTTPRSVEDYFGVALLAGIDPQPSRGQVLGLLDRLERDHYLRRTVDNRNVMSTPLMARIWRVHRRLEQ